MHVFILMEMYSDNCRAYIDISYTVLLVNTPNNMKCEESIYANGNLVYRVVNGLATMLSYDAENHLVSVSGGVNASFIYDGDGNRVKSTINTVTTTFVGNHTEWVVATSIFLLRPRRPGRPVSRSHCEGVRRPKQSPCVGMYKKQSETQRHREGFICASLFV